MTDKIYQEDIFDSFTRPTCAQQAQNTIQYVSHPISSSQFTPSGYGMQGFGTCDFMYGLQSSNRNQGSYTHNSFFNCTEQVDSGNWLTDTRLVADIERGFKFPDKMETIEITSKDLSPASCCSNLDLLIPDFYKNMGKEVNFYNKTSSESQWYRNVNCNGQKYVEYPSCSQINNNILENDDKAVRYCSIQKPNEYENGDLYKNYSCNVGISSQYVQQCDNKNVMDKTYVHNSNISVTTDCGNVYSGYKNKVIDNCSNTCTITQNNLYYYQNPIPYEDGTLDQQTADESNEESDIIVEESEEDITDYSEDLEKKCDFLTNCIICNESYSSVRSQFYILTDKSPLTMSSQIPVRKKISNILGNDNIENKRNYLCSPCLGLINTIDHLQLKLESSKLQLLSKYEKTCKENNFESKITIDSSSTDGKKQLPRWSKTKRKKFKHFCGVHSFKCKLCKKIFSMKLLYERHFKKHRFQNRFLCELCGSRFTQSLKFKLHLKRHIQTKIDKFPKINAFSCKICQKIFRTRSNLREHENFCSGDLPYVCRHGTCDKKFPTATKLKNHVKVKHDKKFIAICSICNIGFVKLSDYKSHMVSHNTEKKFACTKCNKSYKTLSNLNYHMKFHSDKLPFICTICNKGFMRKEYLETHVNNHNGVKNFSCSICGKKFVSQKNLDAHIKYHDGSIKKKMCNICGKSITTGLEEHMRIHNNLREFECNECLIKFNTKGALNKHMKRKHSFVTTTNVVTNSNKCD